MQKLAQQTTPWQAMVSSHVLAALGSPGCSSQNLLAHNDQGQNTSLVTDSTRYVVGGLHCTTLSRCQHDTVLQNKCAIVGSGSIQICQSNQWRRDDALAANAITLEYSNRCGCSLSRTALCADCKALTLFPRLKVCSILLGGNMHTEPDLTGKQDSQAVTHRISMLASLPL